MAQGGWTGPVQRETTIAEVQSMLNDYGANREKRAPVARLGFADVGTEGLNVAYAYAASGAVLAQWAWRPVYTQRNHGNRALFAKHHGLFISG